jgi:chorismate mutase
MGTDMPLAAIRGATTVDADEAGEVLSRTGELVRRIIEANDLAAADIVSIVFTATPDLTAEFPALAVRRIGIVDVPMLCATEIAVPGSLARCVRALVHVETDRPRGAFRHVYLHGATVLRPDLAAGDEHDVAGVDRPSTGEG